jgi:glyoxylase-like metal-dependent hydrolase (beta-lactamase superfamily II)
VLGTLTDDATWAWTWILEPEGAGTRLLSRTRMSTVHSSLAARAATWLLLVPASWVMERRMLLGLRARAEGAAAPPSSGSEVATVPAVRPARRAGSRLPPRETRALPNEIAPDVYCLGPWGRTQTNVYLVHAGSSWALVDAGWEQDAARIEAVTQSLLGPGVTPSAILLTHDHPDHAGSARMLAETWRCPILVHGAEVPIAMGDFGAMERFAGPLDRWVILPAMRAIGDRRREAVLERGSLAGMIRELEPDGSIPGLDGWTWIPTPGHTPGSVAYVRAADRVALTGDALVTLLVNSPAGFLRGRQGLSSPPWYTTWDAREAAASIGAIAALEPTVVGGGHGRPMSGAGTPGAVRSFARRTARPG